ncbi:MAG TPA: hypothetical protein VFY28_00210 [Candidatus Paceibacterota bacterium]|nr:hypothetical protein [Candidatus Paceibacterota bacterium]
MRFISMSKAGMKETVRSEGKKGRSSRRPPDPLSCLDFAGFSVEEEDKPVLERCNLTA